MYWHKGLPNVYLTLSDDIAFQNIPQYWATTEQKTKNITSLSTSIHAM
jgi:hypothetical protein